MDAKYFIFPSYWHFNADVRELLSVHLLVYHMLQKSANFNYKVLIACEYSGIVSAAFRRKGYDVTSCDIIPSLSPGNHYLGDVRDILYYDWDLIIGFPPCTFLTNAQSILMSKSPVRIDHQKAAVKFFLELYHAPCPFVALENPVGCIPKYFRQYDQLIQPWQFGNKHAKKICLWLKQLPPLISTVVSTGRQSVNNHTNSRMSQVTRSMIRSRFFPEVAEAMANQWDLKWLYETNA